MEAQAKAENNQNSGESKMEDVANQNDEEDKSVLNGQPGDKDGGADNDGSDKEMDQDVDSDDEDDDNKSQLNQGQEPKLGTTTRSGNAGVAPNVPGKKTLQKKKNAGGPKRKHQNQDDYGNDQSNLQANQQLRLNSHYSDSAFTQVPMKNIGYVRQRFLYKPFMPLPDLHEYIGELIEFRIYASYLTKFNKAYAHRNFFGTDIYTSDSDPVCILQHVGFYRVQEEEPQDFEGISAYFRVAKGRNNYTASQKYGIRSRKMGQFDGHSIKYEGAEKLIKFGSDKDLISMTYVMPTHLEPVVLRHQRKIQQKNRIISSRIPDVAYKSITPAIVFNLSLDPAFVFNLGIFADKGDDLSGRTCQKLQDNVLYIETDSKRFEISKQNYGAPASENGIKYRFAEVKNPLFKDAMFMQRERRPLDEDSNHLNIIGRDLDWSEFQWGERSLIVNGVRYEPIKNYKYITVNERKG